MGQCGPGCSGFGGLSLLLFEDRFQAGNFAAARAEDKRILKPSNRLLEREVAHLVLIFFDALLNLLLGEISDFFWLHGR